MTTAPTPASAPAGPTPPARLSTRVDVAIQGIRLLDAPVSRRAGAGPSDDGHVLLGGVGAAIPLNPRSPYTVSGGKLLLDGADTGMGVEAVARPRFYDLTTADGISVREDRPPAFRERPRHHRRADLLSVRGGHALPVLRHRGVARGWRDDRGEDAGDARRGRAGRGRTRRHHPDGDDHRHFNRPRPGRHPPCPLRARRARGVPDLPVQVQLEPPGDLRPIQDLYDAGARSIGIHVESLDDAARLRWMPGKGSVPMSEYRAAWAEAVRVFGWNQVSTYILVGLGEDPDELVAGCEELISMGVYPFVVPLPAARRHPGHGRRPGTARRRTPSSTTSPSASPRHCAGPACSAPTRRPAAPPAARAPPSALAPTRSARWRRPHDQRARRRHPHRRDPGPAAGEVPDRRPRAGRRRAICLPPPQARRLRHGAGALRRHRQRRPRRRPAHRRPARPQDRRARRRRGARRRPVAPDDR